MAHARPQAVSGRSVNRRAFRMWSDIGYAVIRHIVACEPTIQHFIDIDFLVYVIDEDLRMNVGLFVVLIVLVTFTATN